MKSKVRIMIEEDKSALLDLFCNTINTVNINDYTKEQVEIWGSRSRVEDSWNSSFENKCVFVYEDKSELLGFCELREDGYIDRFYICADSIGQGVGTFLYMALESKAKELRLSKLFVDASITAKPFFEKMNFSIIKENSASLSGVPFKNYLMENQLRY